jgi:glycosyltransferase involved in cell wall biosynthesis
MRTTCLVNSYNYRHFVFEAVDSVLSQSSPIDQIVVVDDGSTDGSVDALRDRYGDESRVEIVSKPNGGQLSCFEAGVELATGDVVFFLDADDVWEPSYVQKALKTYESYPATDFVFCGLQRFGEENGIYQPWTEDRALGHSVAMSSFKRRWNCTSTSALSMRRWVLERIFPAPFAEDWRIRADDCLVYGADVVGASKHYLAGLLVRYRVHDGNRFYRQEWSPSAKYRRKLALGRFLNTMQDRMGWDVERLLDLAHLEFETIERPTLKELRRYSRLVQHANCSILTRLERVIRMAAVTLQRRLPKDTESTHRDRAARFDMQLAEVPLREPLDGWKTDAGQQRYSLEFQEEAVRQVIEHGRSVKEIAACLRLPNHSLHKWVKTAPPRSHEQSSDELFEAKSAAEASGSVSSH